MPGRSLVLGALLCGASAWLGCGSGDPQPPAPAAESTPSVETAASAAPAAAPQPPELRLPRSVVPESNRVQLVLDPDKETFSGRIEISARVAEATSLVWLNAENLSVSRASAVVGGETWPLEVLPQQAEKPYVGLRAPRELAPGAVVLDLEYTGKIDPNETLGVFRQKDGERWYAFTQFEPLAARRAFPCFDEPDSKVPWQLTLEVPESQVALSNTLSQSEERTGRGTKLVRFAQTKPLPSYLVAFAVGPFELVDGGTNRTGTQLRVAVAQGRSGDVQYTLDTTPPILALLEDYFGTPYPFEKLDSLAIPLTVNFGAMENPGLITYNERLLAAKPADFTIGYQRRYANVGAHELAHQWFGNVVTMRFWDDLWLNEAFATWMAARIVEQWKPEWGQGVGDVTRRSGAIGQDSLASTRRIRQPIQTENDIENAFDGITYQKGASVIRMFERWVGPDAFREGVRAYLAKHAGGNATSQDFLAAVGAAAGRDVATPFNTFLDQVGTPLVSFELRCEPDATPRLALAQERYLPLGSRAEKNQQWQVPVCVKYPGGESVASECTLLTEKTAQFELQQAASCPEWILPNDGEIGYYRSALPAPLLDKLLTVGLEKLTLPERVGAIGDVAALVSAGRVDMGQALGLVTRFANDPSRYIVESLIGITRSAGEHVPDELRPNYARFVRQTFGERARALGWKPQPGEDEDTQLLRTSLLDLVADDGEDPELAAQARTLALAWIEDPKTLDPNLVGLVLGAAARSGDTALFDRFYAEAQKAQDRAMRQRFLAALEDFRQPELVERASAIALSSEFDVRESFGLLFGGLATSATRRGVYDRVKANYEQIAPRLPGRMASGLLNAGTAQCDPALRDEVESFFRERIEKVPGGPRSFAQGMERMELCIAAREALRPSIAQFLGQYGGNAGE